MDDDKGFACLSSGSPDNIVTDASCDAGNDMVDKSISALTFTGTRLTSFMIMSPDALSFTIEVAMRLLTSSRLLSIFTSLSMYFVPEFYLAL